MGGASWSDADSGAPADSWAASYRPRRLRGVPMGRADDVKIRSAPHGWLLLDTARALSRT